MLRTGLLLTLSASLTLADGTAQDAGVPDPRPGELWTLPQPGKDPPPTVQIVSVHGQPAGIGTILISTNVRTAEGDEVTVLDGYLAPALRAALGERVAPAVGDAVPLLSEPPESLRFAPPGVEPDEVLDRSETHAAFRAGQHWKDDLGNHLLIVGTGRVPGIGTIIELVRPGHFAPGSGRLAVARVLEATFRAATLELVRDDEPLPGFDPGACVVRLVPLSIGGGAIRVTWGEPGLGSKDPPGEVLELHRPAGDPDSVAPFVIWRGVRMELPAFTRSIESLPFGTSVDIRPQRNVRYVDVARVVEILTAGSCAVNFWATRTDVLEVRMVDDGAGGQRPGFRWRSRDLDLQGLRAAIANITDWPSVSVRADPAVPQAAITEVLELYMWSGCERIAMEKAHEPK